MEKALLKIDAKKSLGQHFLNNAHVPKAMADAGNVTTEDTVLEIGPGTGVLTRELLKRGARVVAVEADMRAISVLEETFSEEITAKKLSIIHGDVRTIDLSELGIRDQQFKIVANIPYYLSGMLFRLFLENEIQPTDIVFLVQREVAERIARDKKSSLLSLSIDAYGKARYVQTVKRGNFTPPPKIDSAIIAITAISKQNFTKIPEKFFFALLHEGFKSKRKQLLGNLSSPYDREALIHIFEELHLSLKIRGEDLDLTTWLALAERLFLEETKQK